MMREQNTETGINWNVTREDNELIHEIVQRAGSAYPDFDRVEMAMDITAVHANGCPLDLAALLTADPFDFAHDINGIQQHIDRATGALVGGFWPRFARKV